MADTIETLRDLAMKADSTELLARIKSLPPMTAAEIREQRVSWVYGQLGHKSRLSKDDVRAALDKGNTL